MPAHNQSSSILAHLSLFAACAIWGLMAPVGKDAMANGISGLAMVTFRAIGGAVCFWTASLFAARHEKVKKRHLVQFIGAGLLAVVFNQCCFTIGLSLTSPVNASIVTTTLPLVTMVLAALFLKEPVTWLKAGGVLLGGAGALLLILGGGSPTSGGREGNLTGDLLCIAAQCSFAAYLSLFRNLIRQYSVITCMKWMFLYAALFITPFSFHEISTLPWQSIPFSAWVQTGFVVVGATFLAYILMMKGQQTLRPTIVSMYNYVQPIVSCIVSVAVGLGVFGWSQGLAVVLVFSGVWLVTQSKSRAQTEKRPQAAE